MIVHNRQTVDYVSKLDADEPKTVFRLGMVDHVVLSKIQDSTIDIQMIDKKDSEGSRTVIHGSEKNILLAKCGIKGWENLNGSDGQPIPCVIEKQYLLGVQVEAVTNASLSALPFAVIQEIGQEVHRLNVLGETERKN